MNLSQGNLETYQWYKSKKESLPTVLYNTVIILNFKEFVIIVDCVHAH